MNLPLKCPRCSCVHFRFRLPDGRRLVGPITEKTECIINLLTDPEFKEPGEPNLVMILNCARCGWSILKLEGEPLQDAYTRTCEKTLRP